MVVARRSPEEREVAVFCTGPPLFSGPSPGLWPDNETTRLLRQPSPCPRRGAVKWMGMSARLAGAAGRHDLDLPSLLVPDRSVARHLVQPTRARTGPMAFRAGLYAQCWYHSPSPASCLWRPGRPTPSERSAPRSEPLHCTDRPAAESRFEAVTTNRIQVVSARTDCRAHAARLGSTWRSASRQLCKHVPNTELKGDHRGYGNCPDRFMRLPRRARLRARGRVRG